jgi:hypothetical protein
MSFMMGSNGTTIQYVFFIKIITEAQAQKGGRRPDGTITVARQCDILALTSFGSIQGKTIVQNSTVIRLRRTHRFDCRRLALTDDYVMSALTVAIWGSWTIAARFLHHAAHLGSKRLREMSNYLAQN